MAWDADVPEEWVVKVLRAREMPQGGDPPTVQWLHKALEMEHATSFVQWYWDRAQGPLSQPRDRLDAAM